MEIIIILGMVGVIIILVTWLGKEILKEYRRKKKVEMIIFQEKMEARRANEERLRKEQLMKLQGNMHRYRFVNKM